MHDVVLLAGGGSRRMTTGEGDATTDKLTLRDDTGRSLLDAAVAGALGTAAAAVIVVGPRRPSEILAGQGARDGAPGVVLWRCEEPPGGGPVAGIAAGVTAATSPVVAVTAGDAPAAAEALPELLATASVGVAAVLLDAGGRRSLCLAARRADLVAALESIGDPRDTSVGRLLNELQSAGVHLVEVPDLWGAALDIDTPDDADRLGWRN